MSIACIIVNFNDADSTLELVHRIQTFPVIEKIIIVDNASTDDSKIRLTYALEKSDKKMILLHARANVGYGAGNNIGIDYAYTSGIEYVLIANPDTVFDEKSIWKMKQVLDSYEEIGAVAPVMEMPSDGTSQRILGSRAHALRGASAWPLRSWGYDLLESGPISRRIFGAILHYPRDFFANKAIKKVGAIAGSLLMMRTSDFVGIGGYDEHVFLYAEEQILAKRLQRIGKCCVILTRERYLHKHSVSIDRSFTSLLEKQRLREKSTMYYYRTYLGISPVQVLFSKLFFKVVELEIILSKVL